MARRLSVLANVRVANPCPASWQAMHGDDRVRFCEQCKLHVYNLSDMRRVDAEQLIEKTEGRLCVRYFMRSDGTILTRDCPVGLRAIKRRLAWALSAAAATLGLVLMAFGQRTFGSGYKPSLRYLQPFVFIANRLDPPRMTVAGEIAIPRQAVNQSQRLGSSGP